MNKFYQMIRLTLFLGIILILQACASSHYYIVRHAEKESAVMSNPDVPLSTAGKERAEALKLKLANKNINQIFSTNTLRTKSTAQPLSDAINIPIQTYDPRDTVFINNIKLNSKGNVLIIGHSNTVDDIVNRFLMRQELTDLPESQYGDLFIVKRKGKKYSFEKQRFGK